MYTLQNGIKMPFIGFGTADLPDTNDKDTITDLIFHAIKSGYRLIDTASIYGTEESVGKAVSRACAKIEGVTRKDILVSTKLANAVRGYEDTLKAFDESLNTLQLDYIDIYLIHWPIPRFHEEDYKELNIESWKAMEQLYKQGKVHAIGVCNFLPRHLEDLISHTSIMPMINQLEIHPWYQQKETVKWCQQHGIIVEAWGPFRHGRLFSADNEVLQKMAATHNITVAQFILAWHKFSGIIPLPKSSSKERILSNFSVPDINFSEEEIALIDSLNDPQGHEDWYNYKRLLNY